MNWRWCKACKEAFQTAKTKIASSNVLVHYDPRRPLSLAADVSAYGIGRVISHTMEDGNERPIAFASRTLLPSEKNYAQVEKEALSLIFGVSKFHVYLYGRPFTLITDHKPLTSTFGPKKGVPTIAAACLQRWALKLSAYSENRGTLERRWVISIAPSPHFYRGTHTRTSCFQSSATQQSPC